MKIYVQVIESCVHCPSCESVRGCWRCTQLDKYLIDLTYIDPNEPAQSQTPPKECPLQDISNKL